MHNTYIYRNQMVEYKNKNLFPLKNSVKLGRFFIIKLNFYTLYYLALLRLRLKLFHKNVYYSLVLNLNLTGLNPNLCFIMFLKA